ncbi:hypothetical protein AB7187_20665 [Providencia rettgeri]
MEQGIEEGDIAPNAPIHAITDFYITVINGLTIQACDGADIDKLNQVILNAIKAWSIFDVDIN